MIYLIYSNLILEDNVMKLLIASDIHGSAEYCRKLIKAVEKEGAAKVLLLGDLLYHGPRNNLPAEYAPKDVAVMLNGIKEKISLKWPKSVVFCGKSCWNC